MSTNPCASIDARIAQTAVARSRRFRCISSRRRSSQRLRRRSISSTFSSSSWNGSGVERETISRSSTWISISPVGIFGFTVSGERATTSPVARSTNSFRISFASSAAAGERSGFTTSCTRPVWSRRSTNTSPPWSRRRAAQPATVSVLPTSSARGSPQRRSLQLMRSRSRRCRRARPRRRPCPDAAPSHRRRARPPSSLRRGDLHA